MKFVDVDKFIAKNADLSVNEVLTKLKEEPGENVVPMEFIDVWFCEHYKSYVNPIRLEWENENE